MNLFASLLAANLVLKQFINQGFGNLFFMEGAGSNGMTTPNFATYGASKAGYVQLMKTLNAELVEHGHKNVFVGVLQPGLVVTDMLARRPVSTATARVFNSLAELPATVANYLVPNYRIAQSRNRAIRFLTPSSNKQCFLKCQLH